MQGADRQSRLDVGIVVMPTKRVHNEEDGVHAAARDASSHVGTTAEWAGRESVNR